MNITAIQETSTKSLANQMSFPEVVQVLIQEGVESYYVDLVQNQKTFYMPNGETITENFDYQGPTIAKEFSQEAVVKAIKTIQTKQMTYREFLDAIMEAGCTGYTVYITGRKAIYFGRKGDMHIENFPNN